MGVNIPPSFPPGNWGNPRNLNSLQYVELVRVYCAEYSVQCSVYTLHFAFCNVVCFVFHVNKENLLSS